MQQQSIFGGGPTKATQHSAVLELFVDGAARGNPGPAGIGMCLRRGTTWLFREGFYLGTATNNQAEYTALVVGLALACPHLQPGEALKIISDSQLMVRQLTGEYRVKNPTLKCLFGRVCTLLEGRPYQVCHIPREQNKCADACANKGIDTHRQIPASVRQAAHL